MASIFITVTASLFLFEVTTSYVHPYAARPYYSSLPRHPSRDATPYVIDPRYLASYSNTPVRTYAAPEAARQDYRVYQKPIENLQPEIITLPPSIPATINEISTIPSMEPENAKIGGLDPDVLNNLAIALQLLIIHNLINKPITESEFVAKNSLIELKNQQIPCNEVDYVYPMPNAKFLGGGTFGDDGMMSLTDLGYQAPTSQRAGMMLMSPYDAITRASYPESLTSKREFQNPYSSIITSDFNKDLFSMTDLF